MKKLFNLFITIVFIIVAVIFVVPFIKNQVLAKKCKVEIIYNNEEKPDTFVNLNKNAKMPELPLMVKDYSNFLGWYIKVDDQEIQIHNGEKYLYNYDILTDQSYPIVDNKTTIYAKYDSEDIVVKVYVNNPEINDYSYSISYDSSLLPFEQIKKDFYVFSGWFSYKDGIEVLIADDKGFVSDKNVLRKTNYDINNKEVIIFAKYTPEKIKVEFKLDNDVNAQSKMVYIPYGSSIIEYAKDIRINGKIVTKWSTKINDIDQTSTFTSVVLEKDLVLYPSENIYFLLTIISLDETTTRTVLEGETVTLQNQDKVGYAFKGWRDENGNLVDKTFTVNKELTIKANYELFIDSKYIKLREKGFDDAIYTPKSNGGSSSFRAWSDFINLNNYYDIEALKNAGYIGFKVKYYCHMTVQDDGYQHIFFYSDTGDDSKFYEKEYEYAPSSQNISFETNVKFDEIKKGELVIKYAASGFFLWGSKGNEWNCSNVELMITPYK